MSNRQKDEYIEDDFVKKLLRIVPELPRVLRRVFRRIESFDGT
jgi:hypothetical protein